ncbi:MAG: VWA domain-containing protein [Blastocatellia bacterium]|nr:VWA domain-containing protein [Blastocatellia bacterium]
MRSFPKSLKLSSWLVAFFSLTTLLPFFPPATPVAAQSGSNRSTNGAHIPLPPKCVLRVENERGDIRVTLANRTDLEMLTKRHAALGPAVSAEEIALEEAGNQITITTRSRTPETGIDLVLTVPETTELRLKSESGNIEVTGKTGGLVAWSHRGDVLLNVPDATNADVTLFSNTGSVRATMPIQTFGAPDGRSLQGVLGKGGTMLMGRSERGTVTLTSPGSEKLAAVPPSDPNERTIAMRNRSTDDDRDESLTNRTAPEPLKPNPDAGKPTADKGKPDDSDTIKIASELVTLNASARKKTGEALTTLRKEDFTLYEDGIQQELVHFQSVDMPFNLVLLIDMSGSMREKINLIKRSAMRFVQAARPEDKVAIVTFTSRPRVVSTLTNNRETLRQRIEKIEKPDGGTNFYDALAYTLNYVLRDVRGERNAVVVMSDGVDNVLPSVPGEGSEISFEEIYSQIQESDTLVFPIYLDTEEEAIQENGMKIARAYAIAQRQLNELADSTGGVLFRAARAEDLEGRYDQVIAELRTIYSLGYYPTNIAHDGSFRKIRVRVNRDEAQIRTRRGYYARKD